MKTLFRYTIIFIFLVSSACNPYKNKVNEILENELCVKNCIFAVKLMF